MKIFVSVLFLAGFAMEHMVVCSDSTGDERDLMSFINQHLTLKREFNDYKLYNEKAVESLIAVILEQNKKLEDLTKQLQVLKDTPNKKDPAVAFIATKTSANTYCNGYIRFENVLLNNGSGFDTRINYYHQFIAPMSGIYLFSVQVCYNGNGTYYRTNTNNVNVMLYSQTRNQEYGASHYQSNYESCSSMTTTAYLSTNDTIGVLCRSTGDILQSRSSGYTSSYWTMFTGALINT